MRSLGSASLRHYRSLSELDESTLVGLLLYVGMAVSHVVRHGKCHAVSHGSSHALCHGQGSAHVKPALATKPLRRN
jgi:hypothetical protein